MKPYIKAGFDEDIKALPEAVQTWFYDNYGHFKDDVSWGNDAWPTFEVCDRVISGEVKVVLLNLSGLSNHGDSTIPGFNVVACAYDAQGGYGLDGNEDVLASDSDIDMDNVHWTEMFACIEQCLAVAED